jgi:hypothetical protein
MVLPVTKLFTKTKTYPIKSNNIGPMLNDQSYRANNNSNRYGGFSSLYQKFWKYYRTSPELVGIVNLIATDIIGERPMFVDVKGEQLGRNKYYDAKRKWRKLKIKEKLKGIIFDMLITGDGYGWKGRLDQKERLKEVKKIVDMFKPALKTKEGYNKLYLKASQLKDLKVPLRFEMMPSSTVTIDYDDYEVLGYYQRAGGKEKYFDADDIIHFRLNYIDGMPAGFSPVESLIKELSLLWFVKGNMLSFMENGGNPGKLFILENNQPGTPAYKRFEEQLIAFKDVRSRHGNMLATGKVNIQDLDEKAKDMEYKELGLYVTGCLALAFNIPVTRIPFLLGDSANKGDSGGMAESGYWKMIAEKQDYIEDKINYELLDELDFNIQLPRSYKQDEVREAQTIQMNVTSAIDMANLWKGRGKKLSDQWLASFLNVPITELTDDEDYKSQQQDMIDNPDKRQNLLSNMDTEKEPDNRKRADTKRNVANSDGVSSSRV